MLCGDKQRFEEAKSRWKINVYDVPLHTWIEILKITGKKIVAERKISELKF